MSVGTYFFRQIIKKHSIALLWYSCCCLATTQSAAAQEIEFLPTDSPQHIIATLFEGKFDAQQKACRWKPNLSERLQFGESFDGMLYTELDTIFEHRSTYGTVRLLLTATYFKESEEEYAACHFCAPVLSIIELFKNDDSNHWNVVYFEKYTMPYGAWGNAGEVALIQLGEEWYAVEVSSTYTGQGVTENIATWYTGGKEILSYIKYADNMGMVENEADAYQYNTTATADKNLLSVVLHKTGTDMDWDNNVIKKVDETIFYELKDGILQRVCK